MTEYKKTLMLALLPGRRDLNPWIDFLKHCRKAFVCATIGLIRPLLWITFPISVPLCYLLACWSEKNLEEQKSEIVADYFKLATKRSNSAQDRQVELIGEMLQKVSDK